MANFHVLAGGTETPAYPAIRKIGMIDLMSALSEGTRDFWAKPSHYAFLGLIYPVMGVLLALWTSGANTWPLLYPLVSGFALVGPFAALPLYEISRRLEAGEPATWSDARGVLRSPALPAIAVLGLLLFAVFTLWLTSAQALYEALFGFRPPASLWSFVGEVLTTQQGWTLIVAGNLVGLVFAVVTLATTVVAFPMLLDRDCGAMVAVQTSVRAVIANPVPMALWGLIVAGAMVLGSLPLLVGLAVAVPVLGHATWHLYRRIVV